MNDLRAREDAKRQVEYLERAYQERTSQQQVNEDEGHDEELWDPIDDVVKGQRGNYVELIRHFLWAGPNENKLVEADEAKGAPSCLPEQPDEIAVGKLQAPSPPTSQRPSGLDTAR